MSEGDIKVLEEILLSQNKKFINILEWGSGGSTEYFSSLLTKNNIHYDWLSIEYNKKWYNEIAKMSIPYTSIVLFDVGNNELKQRYTKMDEYVEYPCTLNKKFDLVLVDGRKRRRCLINASKIIEDTGIVLLHDADRKYYHCAFINFKIQKYLSKTLWMGKINP